MKGLSFQIYVKKVVNEYKEKIASTGKFRTKYEFDNGCLSIQNSKRSLSEVMKVIDKILKPYIGQEEVIGRKKLSFKIQVFQILKQFKGDKKMGKASHYKKVSKFRSIYNVNLSQQQLLDAIKLALEISKSYGG